jgi:hypothetical protein
MAFFMSVQPELGSHENAKSQARPMNRPLWFRGVISSGAPQRGAVRPLFQGFVLSWLTPDTENENRSKRRRAIEA